MPNPVNTPDAVGAIQWMDLVQPVQPNLFDVSMHYNPTRSDLTRTSQPQILYLQQHKAATSIQEQRHCYLHVASLQIAS